MGLGSKVRCDSVGLGAICLVGLGMVRAYDLIWIVLGIVLAICLVR